MKHQLSTLASVLVMSGVLFGCSALVKTPYKAPEVAIAPTFAYNNPVTPQSNYPDQWWTLFNDTSLNHLIEQVIQENHNLAIAGMILQQARLKAGLAQSQEGLRVNASSSTGHRFTLQDGSNQAQGVSASVGVSYELDLFGKLSHQTQSAEWEAKASAEDLQATAQALIATTAKLYWQLAYLNESKTTAQQSLAHSKQLNALVNTQYKLGAVSGLETTQAAQAVQSQVANLNRIEQSLVETRTALAVLLHIPVQQLSISEPKQLPQTTLPRMTAGLPASLLARRPDLQASELRLRKTLENTNATRASYYPSISLTSNVGTSSTSLSELIKNPILTLGANLSLPFLQYNDMKHNLAVSQLEYDKAILQYKQTLYQAFADVENALSNQTQLANQVQAQSDTLALSERSEQLILIQYKYGAVALKNVLDQQENTRNTRLNLVNLKQSQYNAYVTLIQALGGRPIPTT
ncbi:efflux transporter outer membrane subunit [Acinetobacter rathckeae]|uniref:efflux transporter outer membrane subunit n=1 Tax=Acinetobacter rathckeae TaxID=2605272 RepID=UPI0018A2DAD2|nr:efflux transporter outer membrane subunit [Acinetobacter rathckeae]MBF7687830.1 efflux transporter outer membrane subunit [Acinetobacter rathckeae]MBF7687947.1 efflux transporter outer membrane subunit [Acinetobacter rathckeae]MBF7696000.1 efflux transporter outer membrane subunit [Acinetobacter rathckeae]